MGEEQTSEARRLEALWSGSFGDEYVDRNTAFGYRQEFWEVLLSEFSCRRALEVGCNLGGNLQWIATLIPAEQVFGVDVNKKALAQLHQQVPGVNGVWSAARDLPFRDRWFDLVLTMGVLIHQPESTLPLVMAEMVRCSSRWILCGEYFAEETQEVHYRGHQGALFRRDYGRRFQELFPELRLVRKGFLGRDQGWDDITWWLLERP